MKAFLRKLFAPVLRLFETGETGFVYKSSHRTILIAVGALFLLLAAVSLFAALATGQAGAWLPCLIFCCAGLVCEIVGWLGSDQAVAKIWGSR